MKKENWLVIIAGVLVGVAALVLTKLGNPANMGFCIACFERDIAGAVGLHSAAKVLFTRVTRRLSTNAFSAPTICSFSGSLAITR